MPSMREVAAHVGVSQKTVSRVFNNDPQVRPDTRTRVLRGLHELQYTPNTLASDLRNGRAPVIGIAVPEIVDPYFAAIVRAVDEVARRNDMSTVLTSLGDDPEREPLLVQSLLRRSLSGLVVVSVRDEQRYLQLWAGKVPIVFVDRRPSGVAGDSFTDNDAQGGRLATEHLLSHGHRSIAFMGDRLSLPTTAGRLAGYQAALADAGVAYNKTLIGLDASDETAAPRSLDSVLRASEPPTAVFCSNARVTMVLMPLLQRLSIAVVSFGDFPMAAMLSPALTVIDQDPARIGTLAATRIIERIAHPSRRFRRRTVLNVELIERESCRVAEPSAQRSTPRPRSGAQMSAADRCELTS